MIVVDTNVIAYLLISGDRSEICQQVLNRDPVWAAPLLWRSEFRNVLTLYVRQSHLPVDEAVQIMDAAIDLMHGNEYELDSRQVLESAARHGCSAYDAEFVTLADDLNVALVTVDRRLRASAPKRTMSPESFLAPEE